MEIEDLPPSREFVIDRGLDDFVGIPRDDRLDGDALSRRGPQDREIPRPRHRHVESARNRRGGKRQDVGGRLEPLEEFLVPDAEALLLVYDNESEIVKARLLREDGVRSDDDVADAGCYAFERAIPRAPGLEARDGFDSDGSAVEAGDERLEMLLRENGRRREYCRLPAVHGGDVRRSHRDFRLAVPGVAADESVHRLRGGEIAFHVVYGFRLVFRLRVGERRLEGFDSVAVHVVRESREGRPARLRFEKRGREILYRLFRRCAVFVPFFPVEAVERDFRARDADVSREKVRVCGRDVELRALGVFYRVHFRAAAVDDYFGGADEPAYAVVRVDDVFARFKFGEIAEPRPGRGPWLFGRPDSPFREHSVGLRHDGEAGNFESAGKFAGVDDGRAALPGRFEMRRKSLPRGVEQFRMVRFRRAELRESGKGRRAEIDCGGFGRRRPACENGESSGGVEFVRAVPCGEKNGVAGEDVEECLSAPVLGRLEGFGGLEAPGGKLRRGIERSHAFELFAEKFGADRRVGRRRPEIDDPASRRPLALRNDGRGADVAEADERFLRGGEPRPARLEREPSFGESRRNRPGNGRTRRGYHERIRTHFPRFERGEDFQPAAERVFVALYRRRKFKRAASGERLEPVEIVCEPFGLR